MNETILSVSWMKPCIPSYKCRNPCVFLTTLMSFFYAMYILGFLRQTCTILSYYFCSIIHFPFQELLNFYEQFYIEMSLINFLLNNLVILCFDSFGPDNFCLQKLVVLLLIYHILLNILFFLIIWLLMCIEDLWGQNGFFPQVILLPTIAPKPLPLCRKLSLLLKFSYVTKICISANLILPILLATW